MKELSCSPDDETLTFYHVTPTKPRQATNYRYWTKMVKLILVIKLDMQGAVINEGPGSWFILVYVTSD